jgi:hypothetical protein
MKKKFRGIPPELPPIIGNEEWWIHKILTDLFFLCSVVLHHGKKKEYRDLNWIHKKLCDFIQNHPNLQKLILIFRDGLKSSIARGKLIQWILKERYNRERGKAFIYCGIADLAEDHLDRVWKEIVSNKIIQYLFNDWREENELAPLLPRKKSDFEACSHDKGIRYKGIEVDIGSPEKSLTGHHYELGINDNLVNEKNSEYPEQRAKIVRRWQAQEPILAEDAEELVFETTWYPDDLSGTILHPEGKYDFNLLKGKVAHIFEADSGYSVFYCPAEDAQGNPVFPEKVDRAYLDRKRAKMGSYLYSALYLLQPVDDEDKVLRRSWVRKYEDLPDPFVRNLVIDMAGTKGRGSSYTGASFGDWSIDRKLHLPWADRQKLSPLEVVDWIIYLLAWTRDELKRPATNLGIEREKYGIFLYDQLTIVERVKKRFGVNVYLLDQISLDGRIKNCSADRKVEDLVPKYENGLILSAPGLKDYEGEVFSFYKGKEKGTDILHTVFYHFKLEYMSIPKKVKKPPVEPWRQPAVPCDPSFLKQIKADLAQKRQYQRNIARIF